MKKTFFFISAILIGALVIFSCSKDKTIQQNNSLNSKSHRIRNYSVCYMWWVNEMNGDTCVNYYYLGEPIPPICALTFQNSPECDDNAIISPDFIPGNNGDGYEMSTLTVLNYNEMDSLHKSYFDGCVLKGEITINDGMYIESNELYDILGTDYIPGGTFPIQKTGDKIVITLIK